MTARVHVHVCPRCWKRAQGKAHKRARAAFRKPPKHCRYRDQETMFGPACPLVAILAAYPAKVRRRA